MIAAGIILGRPLKWIEDRLENLTAANQAREQEITLRIALDAQGRLLASHSNYDLNNGAYPQGRMPTSPCRCSCGQPIRYRHSDSTRRAGTQTLWGLPPIAAPGRSSRWPARRCSISPRGRSGSIRSNSGAVISSPARNSPAPPRSASRWKTSLLPNASRSCFSVVDVEAFRAEQAATRKEGRYLGLGVATYIEPTGTGRQHARHDWRAGADPHRTDRQGHGDAEHPFAGARHGNHDGAGDRRAARRCLRRCSVFEGDSSRGGFSPARRAAAKA